MKILIFAVRDIVANVFAEPQFASTMGGAERAFKDACADKSQGLIGKHPEDFELYWLGTYDNQDGSFDLLERPTQVAAGRPHQG